MSKSTLLPLLVAIAFFASLAFARRTPKRDLELESVRDSSENFAKQWDLDKLNEVVDKLIAELYEDIERVDEYQHSNPSINPRKRSVSDSSEENNIGSKELDKLLDELLEQIQKVIEDLQEMRIPRSNSYQRLVKRHLSQEDNDNLFEQRALLGMYLANLQRDIVGLNKIENTKHNFSRYRKNFEDEYGNRLDRFRTILKMYLAEFKKCKADLEESQIPTDDSLE